MKTLNVVNSFIERQGFVVLDGGLATELERRGESLQDPLWSAKTLLSAPEKIEAVHYEYFLAGADVAITASYQATFPGLQARGLSRKQAAQAIEHSVTIACQARARFWSDPRRRVGRLRPLIAASIGPYGAFLHDGSEFRGGYGVSRNELKSFHRDRLALLTASGADLLACESIPSLLEAEALLELFEEIPRIPAWISFTCKDGAHISEGAKFSEAVALAGQSPGVMAAGLNCTPPHLVNSLLEAAREHATKPLIAYPNSGELYDISTRGWLVNSQPGMLETAARGWLDRGAQFIGGCCRTTPETIRGIRGALMATTAGAGSN